MDTVHLYHIKKIADATNLIKGRGHRQPHYITMEYTGSPQGQTPPRGAIIPEHWAHEVCNCQSSPPRLSSFGNASVLLSTPPQAVHWNLPIQRSSHLLEQNMIGSRLLRVSKTNSECRGKDALSSSTDIFRISVSCQTRAFGLKKRNRELGRRFTISRLHVPQMWPWLADWCFDLQDSEQMTSDCFALNFLLHARHRVIVGSPLIILSTCSRMGRSSFAVSGMGSPTTVL